MEGDDRNEEWELIARLNNEQSATKEAEDVHRFWEAFEQGVKPVGLRSTVYASWQRSRDQGITGKVFKYQFADAVQLKAILQKNAQLIITARDIMTNLLTYNPDGHINLTDADGVTLCYCGQDITPVGSLLREEILGTNCTGRCLSENHLVYLLSEENYKYSLRARGKHCAAAPVRDEHGKTIAVLTLTANPGYFHYHTVGTVQAAAEAIAQQLILRRVVGEQQSVLESINEGVIVLAPTGTVRQFNRYALKVMDIVEAKEGDDIDNILLLDTGSLKELPVCKDRNVTFCPVLKNPINCLISVVLTHDGGKVISLRENRRIRDITHKVMGSKASYHFDMILGQSKVMQDIRRKARIAGKSDSTVLLMGESGTGKELFAQSIHNVSQRNNGPFLAVNCGAIPRDLVQSELFGYEDGAFTGSRRGGAAGKFELADGGTLFLDEIGDMPLEAQTNLLRVLQESEITRIGSDRSVKVNVRIIAATNRDLKKDVEHGAFRRDLWFRLNVIGLLIPPLRQRTEDITELAQLFSEQVCRSLGKDPSHFTPESIRALEAHNWPGNVRELENIVERTINMTESSVIGLEDLPDDIQHATRPDNKKIHPSAVRYNLQEGEKYLIELCLLEKNGNLRQVALAMNLSRTALYNKIKRYSIDVESFRK